MNSQQLARLRRFAENPPRNVVVAYGTRWHSIAAPILQRALDVAEAAAEVVAQAESNGITEAERELRARLAVLANTVRLDSNADNNSISVSGDSK